MQPVRLIPGLKSPNRGYADRRIVKFAGCVNLVSTDVPQQRLVDFQSA